MYFRVFELFFVDLSMFFLHVYLVTVEREIRRDASVLSRLKHDTSGEV